MVEIDRDAAGKLPELAVGARIADGVDRESDMGSRRIDSPIRRRGGERGDVREKSERKNNAGDSDAPNGFSVNDHDLLTSPE
ncbi:MAG TPA: hypothetical protein VGF57_14685 [Roseiarcus sp.]